MIHVTVYPAETPKNRNLVSEIASVAIMRNVWRTPQSVKYSNKFYQPWTEVYGIWNVAKVYTYLNLRIATTCMV